MSLPHLLIVVPLFDHVVAALREHYTVHVIDGPHEDALERLRDTPIRAIVTNGSIGLSAAQMARLSQLELVCCFGAGYENVDLAATKARGIGVTHAPGVNDATVADHALALMLGLARGLVGLDAAVRQGRWKSSRAERATLNGGRLGIIGLGNIGSRIAARGAAFDMSVGYHTRTPRSGSAWKHYGSVVELARNSDFLVAACPGGPATRHIVNRAVLEALGPSGYFINIARGSVADTDALIDALAARKIAGAGLDVIEGEPAVPEQLLALDNVLFTPHIAGRSPAAIRGQIDAVRANLAAHFAGRPLPSPVPSP